MRRLVDVLALLCACLLAGGIGYFLFDRQRRDEGADAARDALRRFDQEIKLRAATAGTELNGRGWPLTVDAAWFGDTPPRNPLLSDARPWVEVAPPEDSARLHPRVLVAVDSDHASFWYNPSLGVIRARVPMAVSDQTALDLYNRINDVQLSSIFLTDPAPDPDTDHGKSPASDAAAAADQANPGPAVEPDFESPFGPGPQPVAGADEQS